MEEIDKIISNIPKNKQYFNINEENINQLNKKNFSLEIPKISNYKFELNNPNNLVEYTDKINEADDKNRNISIFDKKYFKYETTIKKNNFMYGSINQKYGFTSRKLKNFEQRLQNIEKNHLLQKEKNKSSESKLEDKKRKELEYNLGSLFFSDKFKKSKMESILKLMKNNDKITIFIAFIGIILNIVASSNYIGFSKKWNEDGSTVSILIIPYNTDLVFFFRSLTSIFTLILIFLLYRHYSIRLKYEIFKQKYPIESSLYSTGLIWMLLIEIIICSIHSPPFLNNFLVNITQISGPSNYVDLDIFFSSLIPIRVYLLFRYYSFYSSWADDRAEKICNECNTLGGISFAIKAEVKERPYQVVGILMILSILIFGYALRNLELSFMQNKDPGKFQDWTYVYNGFWCIMITILTVGYGDFYPQTSVGRIIAIIACLWGTFLISLMVVSLTVSVEFTPQEQKAYNELKKGELYRDLKTKALNFIRFSIMLKNFPEKREQIKDPDLRLKYIKTYDQLKYSLYEFSLNRKCVLIDYLKLSETIQEEIDNYVTKLDKMTSGLEKCLDQKDEIDNQEIKSKENIEKQKLYNLDNYMKNFNESSNYNIDSFNQIKLDNIPLNDYIKKYSDDYIEKMHEDLINANIKIIKLKNLIKKDKITKNRIVISTNKELSINSENISEKEDEFIKDLKNNRE